MPEHSHSLQGTGNDLEFMISLQNMHKVFEFLHFTHYANTVIMVYLYLILFEICCIQWEKMCIRLIVCVGISVSVESSTAVNSSMCVVVTNSARRALLLAFYKPY